MAIEKEQVTAWIGDILSPEDERVLEMIIEAVSVTVTKWHGDPQGWSDRINLGAIMLAAHLWRRRATGGQAMASFQSAGAGYVSRHDPQAAMLLGLGGWESPVIA